MVGGSVTTVDEEMVGVVIAVIVLVNLWDGAAPLSSAQGSTATPLPRRAQTPRPIEGHDHGYGYLPWNTLRGKFQPVSINKLLSELPSVNIF